MGGFEAWKRVSLSSAILFGLAANASAAIVAPQEIISEVDLSKSFHTRSAWQFTASQGPEVGDIYFDAGTGAQDKLPGVITLCLHIAGSIACDGILSGALDTHSEPYFGQSHVLRSFQTLYPRSHAQPLFLVRTANLPSGDGSTGILTQILAYDRGRDRFRRIYRQVVGSNENEEVRYVDSGPLRGDVIDAVPTSDAPYGYWVTVHELTETYDYRQILRYRSATHYGDGNPLAVIDSEMPNVERRLGLWRASEPLPLPKGKCRSPSLIRSELWCERPPK